MDAVTPVQLPQFKRVAGLSMRRSLPASLLTIPQIQTARNNVGLVNQYAHRNLGVAPHEMLFAGSEIVQVSGQGQPDPRALATWDISLDFSINYDTWTPITVHDFFDHKGFRSSVRDGENEPQTQTFDMQGLGDFGHMFGVFGDLTLFDRPLVPIRAP